MKRGWKLLAMLCVLAVLIGGYFLIGRINANKEADTSDTEEETVAISKPDKDDIVGLKYVYAGETVELARDDSASDWVYADDESFPLDQTYPGQMLAVIDAMDATRSFTGEDAADYGLDDPAVSITVTASDGTTYEYAIGDENDVTYEYYLSADDSGAIYMVDSSVSDAFSYQLLDLVALEDVPLLKDVQSIEVSTDAKDVAISYDPDAHLTYSDTFVWYSSEDGATYPLGTDEVESLVDSMNAMTWRACVSYDADREALETYGLLTPSATISVRYMADVTTATGDTDENGDPVTTTTSEERTYTLELGTFTGDYCYAKLADSDMVCTIDATLADQLLLAGYGSLRSSAICVLDFDTVTSMDVTVNGTTHTVAITEAAAETTDSESTEATDEETTETTETTRAYTLDGETLEADLGDALLDSISALTWNGDTASTSATALPEVSITFHRSTDTYTTMELTLSRYDSGTYRVSFEDAEGLLIDADYVSALSAAFEAISAE